MDMIEVIKTRRSVRAYSPRPVPADVLDRVLEAARLAPSANNAQPWRFVVVKDAHTRREMARLCCEQTFIAEAPVAIACVGKRYVDGWSWLADNMYLVDCTIALDHLILAARNEGLGTCWIGAFNADQHAALKKLLEVPAGYDLVLITPLGYPKHEGAFHERTHRQSRSDMVSFDRFGHA